MDKKIYFLAIGFIFILGCSQQIETPQEQSLGVPVPGNEDVKETIVVEEPVAVEEPEVKEEIKSKESKEVLKEFTMTAKRFDFSPSTITVNKGDKVKITITSTDVAHGFSLPDFNINERLEPNQPVTVEFVADKVGTFTFRCNVPCGSGHSSMKGTLIVK